MKCSCHRRGRHSGSPVSSPRQHSPEAVDMRRKQGSIKIGVSLAGYSTDFWSSYVAFEKAAATKYGVSLVGPVSSDGDAGKQATQIRTLISQGVNALIINPVDSAAIAPTLAYAASKHIPVVSVDVAPTKGKVYMIVRANNVLYGQNACQYISSHVKGSGHVAMLEGDLASINGLDRKNGFLDCMKAPPEPEGGRVRDQVGHSDGGERREDRSQHLLRPQGHLRALERARCRGSSRRRRRPGSSRRSARRITSSSSATTGRRRSTAGSAPDRRTRPSRSRRPCTRSSPSTTRSRRSRA